MTFGGAYSNHIYATAAAANELGFESIGIIRGEKRDATIKFGHLLFSPKRKEMKLHYVTREDYRKKTETDFQKS
ncbi:MAG: hypothetical protein U5K54_12240 [Cytophagales bacterium]|nr:hypothetical protein [Cytophagales bacterium]